VAEFNALARARARTIISDWGIEHPTELDLHAIASELGLLVTEKAIVGSAARLICNDRGGLIVINETIREPGKKRFATAHELGHFTLHRKQARVKVCTDDSFLSWYAQSDMESDSNTFAAELLMPNDIFSLSMKGQPPSFSVIKALREEFLTSLTATSIRFVELSNHPCALIASHQGRVSWFCLNRDFPHRLIAPGSKLDPVSCAGEYFSKGTATTGPEMVPGDAWLEDRQAGQRCALYEDLMALASYQMALSLLWIQQDRNLSSDICEDRFSRGQRDPDHFTPDGKRYRW
jgi:Zn-dependent peptidase ImmA (M78 family)